MNVLVSLTNKDGSDRFLKRIEKYVDDIYASDGTKKFLVTNGISCKSITELTGFKEMLGGRVKTLHPAVFAGILAKSTREHMDELKRSGYPAFDLVLCNLYDFGAYTNGTDDEKAEHIDIGGVALIRAAAKNWERVAIVKDQKDYDLVSEELRTNGAISKVTRKKLAIEAFRYTTQYDDEIVKSLSESQENISILLENGKVLRYGENPSQKGILYEKPEMGDMEVFHGKEMSYNNYVDASSAIETALDFQEPFAVVIKHNTPCGAAIGKTFGEALEKAIEADRESAFGSVICLNGVADAAAVRPISKLFVEILIARDFTDDAKEILSKKKNLRLVKYRGNGPENNFRTIFNGILQQDRMTTDIEELKTINIGDCEFDRKEIDFAWKVVAHCRSNSIVLTKDGVTVGIGAGQTSRVEAVKIACERAGQKAVGSLMASDAYLPFPDNVEIAQKNGIKGIVEPGGSIRDSEVIEASKKANISLYFTGMRVFLH